VSILKRPLVAEPHERNSVLRYCQTALALTADSILYIGISKQRSDAFKVRIGLSLKEVRLHEEYKMRNEQGKVERARDGEICKMEKTETLLYKVGLHCMSLLRLVFRKLIFPTTFYKRKIRCNNLITDCRGPVVNTCASYSVGPGFKSRPEDRLYSLNFCGFPQYLQANVGIKSCPTIFHEGEWRRGCITPTHSRPWH
jgi:hypothetical protein